MGEKVGMVGEGGEGGKGGKGGERGESYICFLDAAMQEWWFFNPSNWCAQWLCVSSNQLSGTCHCNNQLFGMGSF